MTTPSENQKRHLSGEAFARALRGETVQDEQGKDLTFLNKADHIIVDHVVVNEPVILPEGAVYPYSIKIHGGEFRHVFSIEGGEFKDNFFINGGKFRHVFSIEGGEFRHTFIIRGGEYRHVFSIEGGEFKDSFLIQDGKFRRALIISGGEFLSIQIQNISCGFNLLKIYSPPQCPVHINNTAINTLHLSQSLHGQGKLYIKQLQVNTLQFQDFSNESLIDMHDVRPRKSLLFTLNDGLKRMLSMVKSDVRPRQFHLNEATFSSMSANEKKARTTVLFKSSNLGNINFFETAFDEFDRIEIASCRLTQMKTMGGHFPLASANRFSKWPLSRTPPTTALIETGKGEQDPKTLEEVYSQLYLAMKNSGNRTWEMLYYAEYMEWHRQRLKAEKTGRATRIMLWLNKKTTRYNSSWLQSFVITIAASIILYNLYCLSLGLDYGWEYFKAPHIWFHCGHFIEYMLPIHKFSFMNGHSPNGKALVVDGMSRIIIGYMIYQTITAFRWFGRR